MAVTLASPLVCDVETGECLTDICLGRGDVCADEGPDLAWGVGSTCVDALCLCTPGEGQNMVAVEQWATIASGDALSVCLVGNAPAAVGEVTNPDCASRAHARDVCSPTVAIIAGELTIDCGAAELCQILDRLDISGASTTVLLRRVKFSGLGNQGHKGGAINVLCDAASLSVVGAIFEGTSASGDSGGAIAASGNGPGN